MSRLKTLLKEVVERISFKLALPDYPTLHNVEECVGIFARDYSMFTDFVHVRRVHLKRFSIVRREEFLMTRQDFLTLYGNSRWRKLS
ncbi:hypothetical protein KEU06_09505 [Pseudaminobacter sp. 19-2017]|uniref:Uncharacterized protein n=1 Tax=Pseudaminobacter soli (ex Zhang et al. 2022) TaxID=2831468 RepID=A0A942DX03_9HYPH|nr:hypothetical protein [Pseudaminobacter soli]MBS3648841.1 hypothetical protein [Pseudaminobacter soli]